MKLNKFLSKFIYNDVTDKKIKGVKFLIRFIIIPFLLSPILYPYMILNKKRYNREFISIINYNISMKEWLKKYEFKQINDRFIKTDTITEKNPMYYNDDLTNKMEIFKDVSALLVKQLSSIGAIKLYNFININVVVSTDYTSELELLNMIYDKKLKDDTIKGLMTAKNVDSEAELMKILSLATPDIKVILYTISIEYKYIKVLRNLLTYFLFLTCTILTIIVFLTIK